MGKVFRETVQGNGQPRMRIEEPRPDELSKPNEKLTDESEAVLVPAMGSPMSRHETGHGKPFRKGNRAAVGRKPKLMLIGVDTSYLNIKDPRYKSCLRRAEYYMKRRCRELAVSFGYVSVGVSGILSTGSLQLAASKYVGQLAAESTDDLDRFIALMNMSVKLGASARQCELTAWELCAKETGAVKKKHEDVPWMQASGYVDTEVDNEQIRSPQAEDNALEASQDTEVRGAYDDAGGDSNGSDT